MNLKELDEQIIELAKRAKLESWHSFVEELRVPSELVPALVTNRVELIRLAQARPLETEQVDALYKLIAGLIETNQALRQHAAQVANLAQDWLAANRGMISTAVKLKRFAQFHHSEVDEEEAELEVK